MNFPKSEPKAREKIKVRDFSYALSKQEDRAYNSVRYAQNVQFTNDGIVTRPSLMATGRILSAVEFTRENSFILTNALIFKDDEYNKLSVQYQALGSYSYSYYFYFTSVTGRLHNAGYIGYSMADGLIKIPQNIICFSAKPIKGSGIFAFINIQVNSSEKYIFEVYELNSDLSEWVKHTGDEMYIPTFLSGGRGSSYYRSEYDLPEPEYVEPFNLLNGICNCYFTTDGYSESFYLPVKSATSKSEHIRAELLADRDTTLKFTFPKDTFVSNSVSYNEYTVSLAYNGGFLQIFSQPSGFVPQRIFGTDNNLKVTIKHETEEQYNKKAFMKQCNWYSLCSEGSQAVLTGNTKYPSLTLVSAPDNPLYFPESLAFLSGGDSTRITADAENGNKLLVFKENAIYKAVLTSNKYAVSCLTDKLGTPFGETVGATDKGVFFADSGGKIYVVFSDGTIKEISQSINDLTGVIPSAGSVFCVASNEKYMLFADKTAFVLDLNRSDKKLENPIWSVWQFPLEIDFVGGMLFGEKTSFICKTQDNTTKYYYIAIFSDKSEDYYLSPISTGFQHVPNPIEIKIQTALYRPEEIYAYKVFTKAILYMNGESTVTIGYMRENGDITNTIGINISYEENVPKVIRLYPLIHSRTYAMEILASGKFNLRSLMVEYYEID